MFGRFRASSGNAGSSLERNFVMRNFVKRLLCIVHLKVQITNYILQNLKKFNFFLNRKFYFFYFSGCTYTNQKNEKNLCCRNLNGLPHTIQQHKIIANLNVHRFGWANERDFAESISQWHFPSHGP